MPYLDTLLNELINCLVSIEPTEIRKQLVSNGWAVNYETSFSKRIDELDLWVSFNEKDMCLYQNRVFYWISEHYFLMNENGRKEEWQDFENAFDEIHNALMTNDDYRLIVIDYCYSDDEDLGAFKYAYYLYKEKFIVGIQQTYSNHHFNPAIVPIILLDKTHATFPFEIFGSYSD